MKKTFLIPVLVAILIFNASYAQLFVGEKSSLSFFSKTSMENIDATNTYLKPILNTANGSIAVKASQVLFAFKSSFMQDHYNENYMESEKYPYATFTGKINDSINYTKDGMYTVTVTGILNMHGVDQNRTIKGTLIVEGGKIIIDSKFDVKVADHKIKVPSLYIEKIAEIIQVAFHTEMVPYKK